MIITKSLVKIHGLTVTIIFLMMRNLKVHSATVKYTIQYF